mmetsp:Transcript_10619/g.10701  ORF Transcript_10619/g.10701 Transcript_10619/m.10701 type:complete len:238 (-) Transcript_10619:807-1520(-)
MKEYKKFFNRHFYKMEQPQIGKRADVLNKKAVFLMCKGHEEEGLRLWDEALNMKESHFATKINFILYRWKSGQLSDGELVEEIQNNLIGQEGEKAVGLEGLIKIAIGDKQEGMEIVKGFIQEEEKDQDLKNFKRERKVNELRDVYMQIQLEKEGFFQNFKMNHHHAERIEQIQINSVSKYFCSTSKDCINVWTFGANIKKITSIPLEQQPNNKLACKAIANLDSEGKQILVYKGFDF